jgi:2'-5' RNA ligase
VRLFAAVDLPVQVRHSAAESAAVIRAALDRARSRSRIAWVPPDRMHLTVVFFGEVAEAPAAALIERFTSPLALAPFRLRFGTPGLFPPAGRPRVLWLAVEEGAAALASIHAALAARFEGLPWARDGRAFSPHLTVGRFKEPGTLDDRAAVAGTRIDSPPAVVVDHVTLYQSRLSPRGPDYTVRAESRLVPEAGA